MPKTSEKSLPKPVAVKAPAKGRPCLSGRRFLLYFPRLPRAAAAEPQIRRAAGQRRARLLQHAVEAVARDATGQPPDASGHCLRQVGSHVPQQALSRLQGAPSPAPDDLIPQFSLIREAVRAFDLPCLEQAGFEADDLIATYVRLACERGASATIVSSDKDLMQLVTDCVTNVRHHEGPPHRHSRVIEKFGVPPEKSGRGTGAGGDSTDNVPGVPGIGVKTAAQLIVEYGDLETLLLRAGEIKQPKRREALIENAEKARISRQLVLARRQGCARRAARRTRGT